MFYLFFIFVFHAFLTANLRMGKALEALNCFDVFKFFSWDVRALRMARVLLLRRSSGLYFLFCVSKITRD